MASLEGFEPPASTFVASRSSPTELQRYRFRQLAAVSSRKRFELVGVLGFEPRTYGLKARCANQLRYTPMSRGFVIPGFRNFDMALSFRVLVARAGVEPATFGL